MVPAVVVHEEGGVGETYAGVFAPQQRTQGRVEVLYAVGAAERANFIQPMQGLAIVGVHGHSYRIAEAPFRDVHAQVFDFLKQPLVEKRLPCGRLERAKRAQHIPENKVRIVMPNCTR